MNNLDDPAARGLRPHLKSGAALCVERLSAIAGPGWRAGLVDAGPARVEVIEPLLDDARECHGSWFSFPGGSILVVIPYNAGVRMTDRFTRGHAEIVDTLDHREGQVLAEVSSMLVNAFAEPLSAALDCAIIVSAPATVLDTQREVALTAVARLRGEGPSALAGLVNLEGPGGAVLSLLVLIDAETARRFGR